MLLQKIFYIFSKVVHTDIIFFMLLGSLTDMLILFIKLTV